MSQYCWNLIISKAKNLYLGFNFHPYKQMSFAIKYEAWCVWIIIWRMVSVQSLFYGLVLCFSVVNEWLRELNLKWLTQLIEPSLNLFLNLDLAYVFSCVPSFGWFEPWCDLGLSLTLFSLQGKRYMVTFIISHYKHRVSLQYSVTLSTDTIEGINWWRIWKWHQSR